MKIALLTTDSRENFRDYSPAKPYFGTAPEALLQGLALMQDVEIHVISCLQQKVPTFEQLTDNIHYHALFVPKSGWMRTGYQGCVRAVRRKLREIRPHIVHGQGTERDCALSAVFSGHPNVITVHGNMRLIAKLNQARAFTFQWLAARLERFTLPRSDGVVCITNYTRQAVASLAKRTWVVPNAVDQSFFSIIRHTPEKPRVLCVGNISYRKNQLRLIEALDPLAAKLPIELIFLGGAPEQDFYVQDFRRQLGPRRWCMYRGFSDRESIKKYLQSASVLVLPSLEDNCPMVVLEAMAAGVPVVAASVGGVPELIDDGETGLLCNPLEIESIRGAVLRILADAAMASSFARSARKKALEKFYPKVVAGQHVEIYRQVTLLRNNSVPPAGNSAASSNFGGKSARV